MLQGMVQESEAIWKRLSDDCHGGGEIPHLTGVLDPLFILKRCLQLACCVCK